MPTTVEEEPEEEATVAAPKETAEQMESETKTPNSEKTTTAVPVETVEVTTHQAFIPPLEYLTHVPPELLPPLFPMEQDSFDDGEANGDHDDDLPKEGIYQRLIASTTRSAMLANQLAEVNRTLGR